MNLPRVKILMLFLGSLLFFSANRIQGVIIAPAVKLNLTVEDGDMQTAIITQVKFNNSDVDISKKSFMHRKVTQSFNLAPGQYEVEWTTEKPEKPWGGVKEVKKHNRHIVIELSDAVVYINIRGDALTTY